MGTFNQAQYDDQCVKSQDLYAQTKYDILLNYLAGHRRLRILNAGCGSGELCHRLARCGHDVLGIDPEPAYIALAQRHTVVGCTFAVSSIEDYEDLGGFDCVIATDVLEHIADERAAFSKLIGLTRPGGLVLLTVPAGQWLFGYHDEQLGHFRRYSRSGLRQLVSDSCDIETLRYFGCSLIPVCLLYSRVLRRPYPVTEARDARRHPFRAWLLRLALRTDRLLPLPLGTSLLLKGTRRLTMSKVA
jgi:SAM-dependent methyltransferase